MSRRGHVVPSYSTEDISSLGLGEGGGDRCTSRVISSYGSDAARRQITRIV